MLDQFSRESLERLDAYVRYQQSHFEVLTHWWTYALPVLCLTTFALSVWVWTLIGRGQGGARLSLRVRPIVLAHLFLCASLTGWFQGCGSSVSKPPFETSPLSEGEFQDDSSIEHREVYLSQVITISGVIDRISWFMPGVASYSSASTGPSLCRVSSLAVAPTSQEVAVSMTEKSSTLDFKNSGCFLVVYWDSKTEKLAKIFFNVLGAATLAQKISKASDIPAAFVPIAQAVPAAKLTKIQENPPIFHVSLSDQVSYVYPSPQVNLASSLDVPSVVSGFKAAKPSEAAVRAFNSYLASTGGGDEPGEEDLEDDANWVKYMGATKYLIFNGFSPSERILMNLRLWSVSGVGTPWSLPLAMNDPSAETAETLRFYTDGIMRDPLSPYLAHLGSWQVADEDSEPGEHPRLGRAYVWNANSFSNPKYHLNTGSEAPARDFQFLFEPITAEVGDPFTDLVNFLGKGIHFGLEIGVSLALGDFLEEGSLGPDRIYQSLMYFENPEDAMAFRTKFLTAWKEEIMGSPSPEQWSQTVKEKILEGFSKSQIAPTGLYGAVGPWMDPFLIQPVTESYPTNSSYGQKCFGCTKRFHYDGDSGLPDFKQFKEWLKTSSNDPKIYHFIKDPDSMIKLVASERGIKVYFLVHEAGFTGMDTPAVDPFSLFFWLLAQKRFGAWDPSKSISQRFLSYKSLSVSVGDASNKSLVRLQAFIQRLIGQIDFSSPNPIDQDLKPAIFEIQNEGADANKLDLPASSGAFGKLRKKEFGEDLEAQKFDVEKLEWLAPLISPAGTFEKARASIQADRPSGDYSGPVYKKYSDEPCGDDNEVPCFDGCGLYQCQTKFWKKTNLGWTWEDLQNRLKKFDQRRFGINQYYSKESSQDLDNDAPSAKSIWAIRRAELEQRIEDGSLESGWSVVLALLKLFETSLSQNSEFIIRNADRLEIVNSNQLVLRAPRFEPVFFGGVIGSDFTDPVKVSDVYLIQLPWWHQEACTGYHLGVIPWRKDFIESLEKLKPEIALDHALNAGDLTAWGGGIRERRMTSVVTGRNFQETVDQSFNFTRGMPTRPYHNGARIGSSSARTPLLHEMAFAHIDFSGESQFGFQPTEHFDRLWFSQNSGMFRGTAENGQSGGMSSLVEFMWPINWTKHVRLCSPGSCGDWYFSKLTKASLRFRVTGFPSNQPDRYSDGSESFVYSPLPVTSGDLAPNRFVRINLMPDNSSLSRRSFGPGIEYGLYNSGSRAGIEMNMIDPCADDGSGPGEGGGTEDPDDPDDPRDPDCESNPRDGDPPIYCPPFDGGEDDDEGDGSGSGSGSGSGTGSGGGSGTSSLNGGGSVQ